MATIKKTPKEIQAVLDKLDTLAPSRLSGMTYENGIEEFGQWILGEISDEEFEYADKK
jgi:hypothetical protein